MSSRFFFIVGGQRCGTSYLYKVLDDHPQICMSRPMRPEPKYFLNKELDGIDLDNYYDTYFSECSESCRLYGEKSTSYYESEEAARLISSVLPDSKVIFLIRNPVDRALSNYFFSVQNGFESRSLAEVFLEDHSKPIIDRQVSTDPFDYLGRGDYEKFISKYMRFFPRRQVKVLFFDELVGDINKFQRLYEYLEVDFRSAHDGLKTIVNPSKKDVDVSAEITEYLRGYYKEPVARLASLLNKDLSAWQV